MWFEYPAGIRCVLRALHLFQTRPTVAVGSLFEGTCLVCASFSRSILENADSARRCRFRNSQQKRASDLDPIYVWIPKLDVAGSSPVSRSMFSIIYGQQAAVCSVCAPLTCPLSL